MSNISTPLLIGIIAAAVIIFLFILGYLKSPPDTAYIISGLGKKRILIGRAGWRVPFFERVDKLSLKVMQVDVKTSEAVPTNEFINVSVDGVANIKISSNPELLKRAAESLLGMKQAELISLVTQVLEGNMREIVGSVGLKEMVQDRQGVAKKITENVVPDMEKLGIEVVYETFPDGTSDSIFKTSKMALAPLKTWGLTMLRKFGKMHKLPKQTHSVTSPLQPPMPSRKQTPLKWKQIKKLLSKTLPWQYSKQKCKSKQTQKKQRPTPHTPYNKRVNAKP